MTNREIAQEISNRIGTAPVPFDSVYSIALQIYNELGGEQTQFDSVYSILLEILPLVEGGGKPIEEVSELPDASENKDKLFRLDNGEKDVYAAKLLSSETITTNRLPDEQQIDKAYLYLQDDEPYYYKGAWKYILNDGELNGYGWLETYPDSDEWYFVLTQDDAVNVTINTKCLESSPEDGDGVIDLEAHTVTLNLSISVFNWEIAHTLSYQSQYPIPAIYNAPESAQIGNAYISDGDYHYYTGREITLVVSDGEFKGYGWEYEGDGYCTYLTNKIASDIYYNDVKSDVGVLDIFRIDTFENWTISGDTYTNLSISLNDCVYGNIVDIGSIYIPQLNAPDSEQVGNAYITVNDNINCQYGGNTIDVHIDNDIVTMYVWEDSNQDYTFGTEVNASNVYGERQFAFCRYDEDYHYWEGNYNLSNLGFTISSINTIKYQRTETTEEWGWEKVATEEYVDKAVKPAIIDVEELPEEVTDENKSNIYRIEGGSNVAATYAYGILPDNEQIDEAYFDANLDSYTNFYYKGAFKVICTNGEFEGYGWYGEAESFNFLLLTETNAVNVTDSDTYYNFNTEEMTLNIDWDNHIATASIITEYVSSGTLSEINEFGSITKAEGNVLQWMAIPTEQYVDDAIAEIPEYTAGNNISIEDGVISCTYQYNLPVANTNILGGVKVGDGLEITNSLLSTIFNLYEMQNRINVLENPKLKEYLTFESVENDCNISVVTAVGTGGSIIEISKDMENWESKTITYTSTVISTLNAGEKLYIRSNNYGKEHTSTFSFSKQCYVYGNLMSLVKSEGFEYVYTLDRWFGYMFENNTNLLSHPTEKLYLPALILNKNNCCEHMFYGCSNLTTAPELFAIKLFGGCYQYMFRDCTSLTTAPELPATTLETFSYYCMFENCSSLNYIKCLAKNISANKCTYNWVRNTSNTGTFIKNSAMSGWTTGNAGIPSGWTVQDA